jgi:hypothetical protein
MYARIRRTAAVFALLSVAFTLAGCIKMSQHFLIMPDNSGKMTITLGFDKAKMQAMGQQGEENDPTNVNVSEISDKTKGFVAFTKPTKEEREGWVYVTFHGYFEDINAVRLGGEEEGETPARYTFAREGEGYLLEAHNGMASSMTGDMGEEEMPADQRAMMAVMFKDFQLTESYTLPGTVTSAEGLPTTEGRKASLVVRDTDLVDPARIKAIKASAVRRVVSGASQVSDADLKAFKTEMDKAKKEWEELKAEAAKAAKQAE